MTGWKIYIHKQSEGGAEPATFRAPHGALLATWQADYLGLRWIEQLAQQGQAIKLGGDGYPTQYTAQAQHLRAPILDGPPHANEHWISSEGDVFVGTGPGRNIVDRDAISQASPDEWLMVEIWDES